MRKLIISSQASMDMAIDNPQNFVFDYVNDEFFTYAREQLFETDALIMGRIATLCGTRLLNLQTTFEFKTANARFPR